MTQRPLMTTSMTRRLGGGLLALALGLILPVSALAANFVVNSSADPGDGVCDATECMLREAIAAANGNGESDTITFDLAADDRVILLGGTVLTIGNDTADPDLTIDGDGSPGITVNAGGSSGVFSIASGADATLRGLVIPGGNARNQEGGGIRNEGTLTVANSTISGNRGADAGGGIFNDGTLTVEDNTISGNSVSSGSGGGIENSGTLTVTNSTISGNSAEEFGGGIFNDEGTLEIKSSIVAGNTATDGADCANFDAPITSQGFNLEGGMSCGFTIFSIRPMSGATNGSPASALLQRRLGDLPGWVGRCLCPQRRGAARRGDQPCPPLNHRSILLFMCQVAGTFAWWGDKTCQSAYMLSSLDTMRVSRGGGAELPLSSL